MSWMSRIANCLLWSGLLPLFSAPLPRPYTVENYDVSVQADLAKQLLYGEVSIRIRSQSETAISAFELDAGAIQIARVLEGQAPQYFERKGGLLVVVLTTPLHPDERRTITVQYRAGPAPGLKFFPGQVYTSGVSDWMPCNDRAGERSTLHLTIAAPPDAKVAGSGQLTATRAGNGQSITEWQLDSATAPYWFGFALGSFAENTSEAEKVKLRVLGASKEALEPIAAAMRYLGDRSGKPYPGPSYTQVFVHGDAARAMAAGLTLLPESDAQGLAKQPDALWALAREMARQWYGIGIGLKDWSDLWLSDGISAFVGDAFLGQRLGNQAYESQIEHSRQIYNQLRAQDKDRALSDDEWTTREEADGAIPLQKGVCFLYLVRQMVGDDAFWSGLRLYTGEQWGHAATSEDFQKAFGAVNTGNRGGGKHGEAAHNSNTKKSSVKNLNDLFDLWVYGIPNTPATKKSRKS